MKIEHIALQVEDPSAMADWYKKHLGFTIRRGAEEPFPIRFVADSEGEAMIEISRDPSLPMPDYASIEPIAFHIGYSCNDVESEAKRLVDAGATVVLDRATTQLGDVVQMLRDPWGGVPLQLCSRANPMV